MNRRDFFSSLLPTRWGQNASGSRNVGSAERAAPPDTPLMAVIAGRHCLAYQGTFCSTCRERCPVPDAIIVERGFPRVNPALCNGCRICHDLCPAPINAVRLVARPATASAISAAHA